MKSDDVPWLSAGKGGTYIHVIVSPGASKDMIKGIDRWRGSMEISVVEKAEEGKANNAVVQLISEILDIPASTVNIAAGKRSRRKKIFVKDMEAKKIFDKLSGCLIR